MRRVKPGLYALLAATMISPAWAADEVVLRLIDHHTDAQIENFNPFNLNGPAGYVQDFAYEPLWIFNSLNPGHDFPALATSYEIAPDLLSVTYHLRDGVKWSDGQDFTAADVVFTFNYAKAHPDYPMGLDIYNEATGVGSLVGVHKLDDHTVRFNLKAPSSMAYLKIGTIFPLPEHIWKDISDPNNYENKVVVATGPWTEVRNFSRNSLQVCRNKLYRDNDANKIDCLQFPQYSTNEQTIAAITEGNLDWDGDGMTDPDKTFAPLSPSNHYWLPPDVNINLQLNTTKAPFDNLEFRKAVSVAIDRQSLVEIATFGLTTPVTNPSGFGENQPDWVGADELAPYKYLIEYDPAKAKQILDAAGFVDKDGDGWRDNPDGTPIDFKIAVPSGWTDWVNAVQTISENLQDVGVNATMLGEDEGAWRDAITKGDFDVYIMWTNAAPNPWVSYRQMFDPSGMIRGQIVDQAMHQMRIPEIEAALAAAGATTDIDKQKAEIHKVQLAVAKQLPVISLFANPIWYEYSTRHFTNWVTKDNPTMRPDLYFSTHERVKHALQLVPVTSAK